MIYKASTSAKLFSHLLMKKKPFYYCVKRIKGDETFYL